MKKIMIATLALAAAAGWTANAVATEPAPKPTEHCDDKGHATHFSADKPCEHPKPSH
jgi:hypothetical protein